jgi:predicted RNA binding protein YcfA (HicA-like mRNA interferase family)
MPRRLYNWSYRNVVDFLKENGFTFLKPLRGSHERWIRRDGNSTVNATVEVNITNRSYPVKTLKMMIRQSRIDEADWMKWGGA